MGKPCARRLRIRRSSSQCQGMGLKLGFSVWGVGSSRVGTWRPRGLSRSVLSRVVSTPNGVTLIIALLITDLLSPLGLQVWAARE